MRVKTPKHVLEILEGKVMIEGSRPSARPGGSAWAQKFGFAVSNVGEGQ